MIKKTVEFLGASGGGKHSKIMIHNTNLHDCHRIPFYIIIGGDALT
jgi:hypothetical protein